MAHDGSTDERRQWVVNCYWAHGAMADAGHSVVSPDLVGGSSIQFADRAEHDLKGVPGSWHLFAVDGQLSTPSIRVREGQRQDDPGRRHPGTE
jgi:hypothetical protein